MGRFGQISLGVLVGFILLIAETPQAQALSPVQETPLSNIVTSGNVQHVHCPWWHRHRNPGIQYSLIGKDFSRRDLIMGDFRRLSVGGSNFRDAVLMNADFRKADLSGADLRNAFMVGVNLRGANLKGADLRGAHLSTSFIRDTIFFFPDINNNNPFVAYSTVTTQTQFENAIFNEKTRFPLGFVPEKYGMIYVP